MVQISDSGVTGVVGGMKIARDRHMTHFPRRISVHFRITISCAPRSSTERSMVEQIHDVREALVCPHCPTSLCPDDRSLELMLESLSKYHTFAALPATIQGVLREMASYFVGMDAVIIELVESNAFLIQLAR